MPRLEPADRAKLPDTAFAHVDEGGRRRLPINDAAHVRNALARFNQVVFEDETSREQARTRLLKAAKRFGIVPVGFITGQLRSERELGRRGEPRHLPSGFLTMLFTDIEGSTELLHRLGDGYSDLLDAVRRVVEGAAAERAGHIVETRADEVFAVFEDPAAAIAAAVAMQRALRGTAWSGGVDVGMRIGLHSGHPKRSAPNYVGMAVNTTSRICAAGHGGQILASLDTKAAVRGATPAGVRFTGLGRLQLRGIPEPVELFQVLARGLPARFPPLRT